MAIFAFVTNYEARAQQGIYHDRHKVLGKNLFSGLGYSYEQGSEIATYPMWGYPILVGLIDSDFWLVAIQVVATLITCVILTWGMFDKPHSWLLLLLFLPVFMFVVVKWADTWYMLALAWLFYAIIHKSWWLAALSGAVAVNMRPDFLFFAVFLLVISLFYQRLRKPTLYAIVGALISLIPWIILTGSPFSTNGGIVAYVSLGQLPNNPWERRFNDVDGYNYVRSFGIEDPTTREGNTILLRAAYENIRDYPLDYVRKFLFNLRRAIFGGVYVGEFSRKLIAAFRIIFLLVSVFFIFITVHQVRTGTLDERTIFSWAFLLFLLFWVSALIYTNRLINPAYFIVVVTIAYATSQETK